MKWIVLALLFLCSMSIAEVSVRTRLVATRDAGPRSIEVELTLPRPEIAAAEDGFQRLASQGLTPLARPGDPELFAEGRLIAVPDGFEPRLTVLESRQDGVPNVRIRPYQNKSRCSIHGSETFAFNAPLYGSRAMFPEAEARLEPVGRWQGLRLVRLGLYPLRMDFGRGALEITSRLRVRVDFEQRGYPARVAMARAPFETARAAAVNGADLARWVAVASGPETMLVIAADSLRPALDPWIAWKREKGLKVDAVTYTEAGGSKEKVKEYIQRYYDAATTKPSYLLLAGNKSTLPPFFESTSSGRAASDLSYALLSGGDKIPDINFGRLLADSVDEAKTQIDRWIEYEKSPGTGSWFSDGTTIASSDGGGSDVRYSQDIEGVWKKFTYKNVDRFYQGNGNATPKAIRQALEAGRSWLTYIGHGSGTSWGSTNGEFDVGDVDALSNAGRLPIIIDVACDNASWVSHSRCFGKAWVTHTQQGKPAGAIGYYGGSVSISWDPPAVMAVGIAHRHFENRIPTLGASVLAGQLYLVEKMGLTSGTIDNLEWYNLFGDPSLQVRTAPPRAYSVALDLRAGSSYGWRVSDLVTGEGIPDVLLAVTAEDSTLLSAATTDATGRATLEAWGACLTSSGYNLETYVTKR